MGASKRWLTILGWVRLRMKPPIRKKGCLEQVNVSQGRGASKKKYQKNGFL